MEVLNSLLEVATKEFVRYLLIIVFTAAIMIIAKEMMRGLWAPGRASRLKSTSRHPNLDAGVSGFVARLEDLCDWAVHMSHVFSNQSWENDVCYFKDFLENVIDAFGKINLNIEDVDRKVIQKFIRYIEMFVANCKIPLQNEPIMLN